MLHSEKYVVLEHLDLPDRGLRFWSHNTEDNTHSMKGELWYKEILFTNSEEEAIEECRHIGKLPSMHELEDYYNNKSYEENEKSKKE